jgi:hypothetical protein
VSQAKLNACCYSTCISDAEVSNEVALYRLPQPAEAPAGNVENLPKMFVGSAHHRIGSEPQMLTQNTLESYGQPGLLTTAGPHTAAALPCYRPRCPT